MKVWNGFWQSSMQSGSFVFYLTTDFDNGMAHEEFSGHGNDHCGNFTVRGTRDGNFVQFVKHYNGWDVHYRGTICGRTCQGSWSVPGDSGTFSMNC